MREAALRSVIEIEGSGPLQRWLEELSRSGPFTVRAVARQALLVEGGQHARATRTQRGAQG